MSRPVSLAALRLCVNSGLHGSGLELGPVNTNAFRDYAGKTNWSKPFWTKAGNPGIQTGWVRVGTTQPQPRWGCGFFGRVSQGSSCLATLGWRPESRWDSALEFPNGIEIKVN